MRPRVAICLELELDWEDLSPQQASLKALERIRPEILEALRHLPVTQALITFGPSDSHTH